MTGGLLEIEALNAGYGSAEVLFGVDLAVAAGEVVALLGRNGMGKTTTVKTVMGLLPARAGSVRMSGRDMTNAPPYRIAQAGIGLVPEGRQVFPTLTVVENLLATRRPGKANGNAWTLERVLEFFPSLARRTANYGNQLSGGEQQMLAIGRALMGRPRVLMLDEPSMGLAPVLVDQIFSIIKDINAQGTTILLVEQNALMALGVAHRGYVLQTGQIVLADTAQRLADNEMVQKAYLGIE